MIRGSYRRLSDYQMSTTDPDACTMRTTDGVRELGYQDTYVTDGGRARVILSVLVTPGDVMENQVMLDLLWRTCFRWKVWPDQVTGDTTYGTIENIIPIEDAGISMYTPLPDWDSRTPYFGASLFTYDPGTDTYGCPDGQTLRRDHIKYTEGKIVYQAAPGVCNACALKPRCTSSKEGRHIHRNIVASAQNLKRLLRWRDRGLKPASGMAVSLPLMEEKPSLSVRITVWRRTFRHRGRDPRHFVVLVAPL